MSGGFVMVVSPAHPREHPMSNQPVNLDPSLAFTALLEMWQGFGQLPSPIGHRIPAALASDMTTASPANRWEFAQQWVALRRPGSYAGRVVIQAGDDAP